jgi:uncharacterized protein YbjT (DUF2867 family)
MQSSTTTTTAIVFGATGHIGTNLIQYLSKEHAEWKILAVSRKGAANEKPSRLQSMGLSNIEIFKVTH